MSATKSNIPFICSFLNTPFLGNSYKNNNNNNKAGGKVEKISFGLLKALKPRVFDGEILRTTWGKQGEKPRLSPGPLQTLGKTQSNPQGFPQVIPTLSTSYPQAL